MTESSTNQGFSKISREDIITPLYQFGKGSEKLRVCQKDCDPIFFKVLGVRDQDELVINLSAKNNELDQDKPVLVFFSQGGTDYFIKFTGFSTTADKVSLVTNDNFFMYEKRHQIRYQCFPRVEAYFCVPAEILSEDNLLFIDKKISEEISFLKEYKDRIEKKIFKLNDDREYNGYRVLDLSDGGMAFYCNNLEKKNFSELMNTKLIVNGECFDLEQAEVIYNVDFIHPLSDNIHLEKLGCKFSTSKKYEDLLQNLYIKGKLKADREINFENM